MKREEIEQLLASTSWYHRFELVPGIFTPGESEFPAGDILNSVGIPNDLSGKRALDIGTWDGPLAFELERRGAKTTAVDIQSPDNTGFNVAKQILNSSVEYVRSTVYELPQLLKEKQDFVCFRGVYYHLKYPMLAFEKISEVLEMGGVVFFEGECLLHYAEDLSGNVADIDVKAIVDADVPMALCCPGVFKNASNWFVPTFACLRAMIESCGMRVTQHEFFARPEDRPYPAQRVYGLAEKVREHSSSLEHPVYEAGWKH